MFSHEIGKRRSELVDRILLEPGRERQIASESARRYPRPIMDCIQISNDLAEISRTKSAFVDLAEQLEAILGGQVKISTYGDMGFTRAGDNKPTVPFSLSASVVKSLAALVVYFRHQANAHDTIVIDEPELNLHPDVQIHLARFFGQVVNRGFQVIMSTHSDFILRELSNLVRLGEGGEQGKILGQRLGLAEDVLLSASKVGVWYFHDGEAEALPITGAGFHLPSIEAAIHKENIETQEITFGLDDA